MESLGVILLRICSFHDLPAITGVHKPLSCVPYLLRNIYWHLISFIRIGLKPE